MPDIPQSGASSSAPETPPARFCFNCGAAVERDAINCPACGQLLYADAVNQIATEARALETAGDLPGASLTWKKALDLLPAESPEASSIREHRAALGAQSRIAFAPDVARAARPAASAVMPTFPPSLVNEPATFQNGRIAEPALVPGPQQQTDEQKKQDWKKRFGPFGVLLAFLAKFKTAGLLLITKGKFLLLGLTKLNTLLSMFASMALYWALYGWKFGVGFILGIYVHEMGHVWALKHFGLRASAPMFIPGFGAIVSLYDSPANSSQDARIGLAGPIWGTGAALAFLLPGILNGGGIWFALAHATSYINLFNLIPIWQLDGGRGFRALDRQQRLLSMGLMLALWYFSNAGMFLILAAGAAYRVFMAKDFPAEGDRGAFIQYAGLLIMLGALLA